MSILPIVARELRVAARQRRSFVVRVLAAAAAVAAGAFQLWFAQDGRAGAGPGGGLFALLGTLTLGFGLVAGPLWTASTLCEERREGTLGLLFHTDLTAWDVVLGKLMAASVTALFALLAVLPVLAVSLLLGGVSLSQFGRAALVLGNTLWLSLTLGMAMSARCEQERSAMALTVFALFLLAAVLPWAHATWGSARPTPGSLAVLALSPVGAWWGVTTPVYAPAPPSTTPASPANAPPPTRPCWPGWRGRICWAGWRCGRRRAARPVPGATRARRRATAFGGGGPATATRPGAVRRAAAGWSATRWSG